MRYVLAVGIAISLLGWACTASAEEPRKGPSRVLEQFPEQGLVHIPEEPWDEAFPVVYQNLTKNAGQLKSGNSTLPNKGNGHE